PSSPYLIDRIICFRRRTLIHFILCFGKHQQNICVPQQREILRGLSDRFRKQRFILPPKFSRLPIVERRFRGGRNGSFVATFPRVEIREVGNAPVPAKVSGFVFLV